MGLYLIGSLPHENRGSNLELEKPCRKENTSLERIESGDTDANHCNEGPAMLNFSEESVCLIEKVVSTRVSDINPYIEKLCICGDGSTRCGVIEKQTHYRPRLSDCIFQKTTL